MSRVRHLSPFKGHRIKIGRKRQICLGRRGAWSAQSFYHFEGALCIITAFEPAPARGLDDTCLLRGREEAPLSSRSLF
ncbi:MAG: hypothetical protein D6677_00370 [Calditrichaeota bacterium]|nr:MAG: hypothetical protein D6677_00370 [Calditrichota bacterium]